MPVTPTSIVAAAETQAPKTNVALPMLSTATVPDEARQLQAEGRARGQVRDYEGALDLFGRAISIAPGWAQPRYDLAYTLLVKGEAEKALQKYQEVDVLEPGGFFANKTAIWAMERELNGKFPRGTYLSYIALEWSKPVDKGARIEDLIARLPEFTPAWKDRANLAVTLEKRREYLEHALTLDADAETSGMLTINLAILLYNAQQTAEGRGLLEKLIASDKSTRAAKALAGEALKSFK